jgi:TRAP-type C4-dicarboxylate transport system permease small subunit
MSDVGPPSGSGRQTEGLARYRRALGLIGSVELGLALASFTAVVCLTIVQVTLRYGFAGAIWWAQEVSQMMIMVAYFLGAAYVFKTRQYIVVAFLFDRFPKRVQFQLYLVAQALIIVFCGIIVFELISIAESQLSMRTVILHIPRFYGTLPLFFASLSMIATAVYYSMAVWQARAGRPEVGLDDLEAPLLISQPVGEI